MMVYHNLLIMYYFFFKQQRAYEMRISDWSSDVCSSDLNQHGHGYGGIDDAGAAEQGDQQVGRQRRGQDVDQVVAQQDGAEQPRSEERRVGNECVSTCRSRGSPSP